MRVDRFAPAPLARFTMLAATIALFATSTSAQVNIGSASQIVTIGIFTSEKGNATFDLPLRDIAYERSVNGGTARAAHKVNSYVGPSEFGVEVSGFAFNVTPTAIVPIIDAHRATANLGFGFSLSEATPFSVTGDFATLYALETEQTFINASGVLPAGNYSFGATVTKTEGSGAPFSLSVGTLPEPAALTLVAGAAFLLMCRGRQSFEK